MTRTKLFNHLYYVVCLLAALATAIPADALGILPPRAKPYVLGALGVAVWVKAHVNLFVNPDGTPAQAPWDDKRK